MRDIVDEISEVQTVSEAEDFYEYIHRLFAGDYLTNYQFDQLVDELDDHCTICKINVPTVDDVDWELMQLSDPDLSDQ